MIPSILGYVPPSDELLGLTTPDFKSGPTTPPFSNQHIDASEGCGTLLSNNRPTQRLHTSVTQRRTCQTAIFMRQIWYADHCAPRANHTVIVIRA